MTGLYLFVYSLRGAGGEFTLFKNHKVGDTVVVCSGKPYFYKERKRITYVNSASRMVEVSGSELFCSVTGKGKSPRAASSSRRIYLAEGEVLEDAIYCEVVRTLSSLQLRSIKKLPRADVMEAARLLKVLPT